MPYLNAKIYSDGGHYIAIPQGAYPSRKGRQRRGKTKRKNRATAARFNRVSRTERTARKHKITV